MDKLLEIFNSLKALQVITILLLVLFVVQFIFFQKKLHTNKKNILKRSRSVIGGQVAEQIAPYLPDFPCNPNDAHFIGRPIDFLAFPGLTEKNTVDEILLIEVKSGSSALSSREKEVRRAVQEGRVRYVEYRTN